jgi:hypothetical protein
MTATSNIKYRTFTVDTKGRIKKADGYRITTCTIKHEDGLFETGIAVCKGNEFVRKTGQAFALYRMDKTRVVRRGAYASFILEHKEDRVYNILRLVIKRFINTMHSLKKVETTDLR